MSYAEIARELDEDFKNAYRYVRHLSTKKYLKEAMSRPNCRLVFKPIEWTSPRHNKMLFVFSSMGKRELKRNGFKISMCCIFLYRGQLCLGFMSMAGELRLQVQFFTHHFFQRYNERYLKSPDMETMDVIKHFMHDDIIDMLCQQVEHPKLGVEYISALPHGCSFIEIAEDYTYAIHHTFVTDDMLHTEQLLNLVALRCGQRVAQLDIDCPTYDREAMRADRISEMAEEFPSLSEKFHENPHDPDVKEELTTLCFHLSVDILDLVELYPEWEALHRLGKHLLSISSELKGKAQTAALLGLYGEKYQQDL